jgi:hypothetical protein
MRNESWATVLVCMLIGIFTVLGMILLGLELLL